MKTFTWDEQQRRFAANGNLKTIMHGRVCDLFIDDKAEYVHVILHRSDISKMLPGYTEVRLAFSVDDMVADTNKWLAIMFFAVNEWWHESHGDPYKKPFAFTFSPEDLEEESGFDSLFEEFNAVNQMRDTLGFEKDPIFFMNDYDDMKKMGGIFIPVYHDVLDVFWASKNTPGFYTLDKALALFGMETPYGKVSVPSKEQLAHLVSTCKYEWIKGDGYAAARFTGPTGLVLDLPALEGLPDMEYGIYWSRSSRDVDTKGERVADVLVISEAGASMELRPVTEKHCLRACIEMLPF